MRKNEHSTYLWVPGLGPDADALKRMCDAFPKPKIPMGEAWFMGESRQMYPKLAEDLSQLADNEILDPLTEIASGTSNFGPSSEWTDWYYYLLPRVMPRVWFSRPLGHPVELLITAFVTLHPATIGGRPYSDFRSDALETVGRYIMAPHLWHGVVPDPGACLNKFRWPNGNVGWWETGGLLSASLFFCLKYLPVETVAPWMESVLAITHRYWSAQMLVWLVGAHPILTGEITQPAQIPETGQFDIRWEWSHTLNGHYTGNYGDERGVAATFLPAENREAALAIVRSLARSGIIADWQSRFSQDDELTAGIADAPDNFMTLYG